ncbi:MAG: insulinase family protein [Acidobacteriota bacterium]|nr:insulinase family protein [Acidobacteriota bacterium]MDQ5838531.1 insulinase family protein [Acidobacteriota bacterium]
MVEQVTEQVQATRLPNGLTVLTERMPSLRSCTFGVWVRRGSRHESPEWNGICHFIEHAVFKGTERRTALDIAVESDRLGGHFDAFTTHELTGFAMKVVDTALAPAFDLLADMLSRPRFEEEEMRREQRVIIEEMKMVEDTPDEFLAEIFNAAYFPGHPLGRPIEGTAETVSTFGHERTARFHAGTYAPRNLVVAAAGNVRHEELVELAARAFDGQGATDSLQEESGGGRPDAAAPILVRRKKELEQAHLILASPFPSARDEDRYAASLLSSVVGGGTSSRLWQRIREERGLAYSVGAAGSHFTDAGLFQIYAGTSPEHLDEVLDLSLAELRRVLREPVGEDELRLVKDQAVASILLGLESTSARAGSLARQEIIHGRRIPPDEIIARVEAVTPEDLLRVATEFFRTDALAVGALGDLNGFRVDRARLEV